jgi:beta-galactosidase
VIGDFTWTAYDNLGEAGMGKYLWERDGRVEGIGIAEYPWRACYQGDFDLCGYRRPQSYFREAVWIGGTEPRIFTTHPEHYGEGFTGTGWHWRDVQDCWTFDDSYIGKPVPCEVYTDADEIVWYLNGREIGRSTPAEAVARLEVPYEKGELAVTAYKNGEICGSSFLHTVGKPAQVLVEAESPSIRADARDLCYFDITIADDNGHRVPDTKPLLRASVEGGKLMGIFSGDPANDDQYGSDTCHAYEGRAVAIVMADQPGTVRLTVTSQGLADGCQEVRAEARMGV